MVVMKQNEHEVNKIKSLGKYLGVDRFTVKTLNPSCGLTHLDEELLPKNPKYRRYKYRAGERIRINPHCRRVWEMSNIFSNGDVVPCCYDYAGELKVGNINEEPFSKIWMYLKHST